MKQFDISPDVRSKVHDYLDKNSLTLQEAMDSEVSNRAVADIIHQGLPGMVKKLYSQEKMEKLFWNKRDIIYDMIVGRLQLSDAKKVVKKKQKALKR